MTQPIPSATAGSPIRSPSGPQFEAAARAYCQLAGLNADELLKLQKPIPGVNGPIDAIPRWQALVPPILDQWRLAQAMKVLDTPPQVS